MTYLDAIRDAARTDRVARAWYLHRLMGQVLQHFEEGRTQRASARALGVSVGKVQRMKVKLELVSNRGAERKQ